MGQSITNSDKTKAKFFGGEGALHGSHWAGSRNEFFGATRMRWFWTPGGQRDRANRATDLPLSDIQATIPI
jgi:hypothetical protein